MHQTFRTVAVVFLLALASHAEAQIQQGSRPEAGQTATATTGDVMYEEFRFRGVPGVILDGPVQANWGSAETVDLAQGDSLAIIRERRLKACQSRDRFGWNDCLIDTDDDGRFDRVSFNNVGGAKDIVPPVPYRRAPVQIGVDPSRGEGDDFRRQIVFTGSANGTLLLSYREFNNNMARPAFTENLALPLSATFPQDVAVKGHVFRLMGIDGMGLRYQVVR